MGNQEDLAVRYLSSNSAKIESFEPLDCNADLDTAPCNITVSSIDYTSSELHIPCGECWIWDVTTTGQDDDEVNLKGLDIEGKLIFPENHVVHIITPYVFVQGELIITNTHSTIQPSNLGVTFTLKTKNSGAD